MRHKIGMNYSEVISQRKTKRDLPLIGKLKINFNIQLLQEQTSQLLSLRPSDGAHFETFDPASSEHNYHLKTSKGESFIQNYDDFYKNYSMIGFQELSDDAREKASRLNFSVSDLSPSSRLKGMRHTDYEKYHPHYDERNYTKPTNFYKGIFAEVLNGFQAEASRSALVCLKPKQYISAHFDIGPEYLARVMVPIFTNKEAVVGVRSGKGYYEFHLPADGGVYFINSGFEHYAANMGSEPRYQMRVCLNGQEDLQDMTSLEPIRFITDEEFASHPCSPERPAGTSENILLNTLKEFNLNKSGSASLT